jgi:hypothetical protein
VRGREGFGDRRGEGFLEHLAYFVLVRQIRSSFKFK